MQAPHNPAWQEMETLPLLREFRRAVPLDKSPPANYERDLLGRWTWPRGFSGVLSSGWQVNLNRRYRMGTHAHASGSDRKQ